MTRLAVTLKELMPIDRRTAKELADAASRHACAVTLESEGVVLNVKSMIGLLSQSVSADGRMMICASGEGEEAAAKQLCDLIERLKKR